MFFDGRLHEMSIEYKFKAMEMRLKYQQTGNELYKILAEYYEDATDCDKRFKITKKINKKENLVAEKDMKDKRLWKARSVCVYARLSLPCEERCTEVRELTVDEAVSWYKNWVKHLNDYGHDAFTVYSMGLFYKKDGEWVLYEENKENN